MERIFTAEEMKACDAYTINDLGVPSASLMERAAAACADEVVRVLTELNVSPREARVMALCGSGNNGGDGFACARILALRGISASICFAGKEEKRTEETARQDEICRRVGIPYYKPVMSEDKKIHLVSFGNTVEAGNETDLSEYDVLVDALFGVGLSREVAGIYAALIDAANESAALVVAVDIPSGISADTGQVLGRGIRAHSTVTMQRKKRGLVLYPGADYAGRVVRSDIGVSTANSECSVYMLSPDDIPELLPKRSSAGNKGTFGKVLIVAGSEDIAGAAYLSATAALRSGCGMVRVVTHERNRDVLMSMLPEAMVATYTDESSAQEAVKSYWDWADVVACGPGIGTGKTAATLLRAVLTAEHGEPCENRSSDRNNSSYAKTKPLVLDADALNLAAEEIGILEGVPSLFLTPHIGEMSRLTGRTAKKLKADAITEALSFSERINGTCIMKDARTVVARPGGPVFINPTGNAGMATAGSGDVLTGILASLLAQGADPVTAGALACYVHGASGDSAASKYGERFMKAGDIIAELEQILK